MYAAVCSKPSRTCLSGPRPSRATFSSITCLRVPSGLSPLPSRPQHQQVRPPASQPVLPLQPPASVHHPLQVRLQQQLRGDRLVREPLRPVLAVLAEILLERCQQPRQVRGAVRAHVPRRPIRQCPSCTGQAVSSLGTISRVDRIRHLASLESIARPDRGLPDVVHDPRPDQLSPAPSLPASRGSMTRRTRSSSSLSASWSRCVTRSRIRPSLAVSMASGPIARLRSRPAGSLKQARWARALTR